MLYLFLLIYSISSKRTFIAVSDLGGPLKKSSETSQFRFIFPTTSRLKSPPPGIKSPPPGRPHKSNSPVPGHTKQANAGGLPEGGGGGMLKYRFNRQITVHVLKTRCFRKLSERHSKIQFNWLS